MLRDVSNALPGYRFYGGLACPKSSIIVDNKYYMLKFPNKLKDRNFKNVTLDYSNSSLSEFIGSKIFELFKIPVHKTELVYYKGKLCCMCEDFVTEGRLIEFRELITTSQIAIDLGVTGSCTDINVVLDVIRYYNYLPSFEEAFWKMFTVDALIGNHDRNTGNFGIVLRGTKYDISPVYDNGNCLNPTWDDNKMLNNMNSIDTFAYKAYTCAFTNNNRSINPFQFMATNKYPKLTQSLLILDSVCFSQIEDIILSVPILTPTQRDFYISILFARYIKLLELRNS